MPSFKNIDIYSSRLISALCLFWILAEANVWLDPLNNVILVLGYRLFILLTPLFFKVYKHKLTFVAMLILEIGIGLWLAGITILGTVFFAVGISVSGYMLKYYSSFSTKGAAGNKIALNLGSIISGMMVALSQNKLFTLVSCLFLMIGSFLSFAKYFYRENITNFVSSNAHFQLKTLFTKNGLAWALIGFVTGVKLISIVSILPQFIMLEHNGELPKWFGLMFMVNSLIVVSLQLPIMHKIKHFDKMKAILPLFVGMMIVMLSGSMSISTFIGAFVWTFSLSIVECCISYLDKLSQDDNCLLIKEAFVGLGSAATVYLVRFFSPQAGSLLIGFFSFILLFVSLLIFRKAKYS
jgi:hypothetical protein